MPCTGIFFFLQILLGKKILYFILHFLFLSVSYIEPEITAEPKPSLIEAPPLPNDFVTRKF